MTDNQLLHIKAFIWAPQDALYGDFDFSFATSLKAANSVYKKNALN